MTPTVAIIDYGSGNLRSAAKALERVASELRLRFAIFEVENAPPPKFARMRVEAAVEEL